MAIYDAENKKTERILVKKAKAMSNRKNRVFYMNAAILSVYGWQMAIPVLLGVILGQYLDKQFEPEHISWTLNLIIIGAVVGWSNATRWVHRETKSDRHKMTARQNREKK